MPYCQLPPLSGAAGPTNAGVLGGKLDEEVPLAYWPVGVVSPTVAVEENGFPRDKQPAGHCCPFGNAGVK